MDVVLPAVMDTAIDQQTASLCGASPNWIVSTDNGKTKKKSRGNLEFLQATSHYGSQQDNLAD
jgi:hypothetical protein